MENGVLINESFNLHVLLVDKVRIPNLSLYPLRDTLSKIQLKKSLGNLELLKDNVLHKSKWVPSSSDAPCL